MVDVGRAASGRVGLEGVDRRLPLAVLDDSQEVARLLAPHAGPVQVHRQDTKYEPEVSCVAGYALRPADGQGGPVLGCLVLRPDGVRAYLASQDPALPALRAAVDPDVMTGRLAGAFGHRPPFALTIEAVRYKPATRCVLRFALTPARRPSATVWYGKLLATGSTAACALVDALAAAASAVDDAPLVLPVVAHWPDLGLLLQEAAARADELHDLAVDRTVPRRRDVLRGAGRALAAVHECRLPQARQTSLADDLEELEAYARTVSYVDAPLGARYLATVDRLHARATGSGDPPVTSHGAFRTDQLLVADGQYVLIDLDTVCAAEPARDMGNLLAYLDWKAVRHPSLASDLAAAAAAFQEGYAGRRPAASPDRLQLYRAASLLKIAGRRYRSLTVREWPLVPRLLDAADMLVPARTFRDDRRGA